jgi:hypothetical protein
MGEVNIRTGPSLEISGNKIIINVGVAGTMSNTTQRFFAKCQLIDGQGAEIGITERQQFTLTPYGVTTDLSWSSILSVIRPRFRKLCLSLINNFSRTGEPQVNKKLIIMLVLCVVASLAAGACSVEPVTTTATVSKTSTVTTTPAPVTKTVTATVTQTTTAVQTITTSLNTTGATTELTETAGEPAEPDEIVLEIDNQAPIGSIIVRGEPGFEISGNTVTITILMSGDATPTPQPYFAKCTFLDKQGAEMGVTALQKYNLPPFGASQTMVMEFEIIGDPAQLQKVVLTFSK